MAICTVYTISGDANCEGLLTNLSPRNVASEMSNSEMSNKLKPICTIIYYHKSNAWQPHMCACTHTQPVVCNNKNSVYELLEICT